MKYFVALFILLSSITMSYSQASYSVIIKSFGSLERATAYAKTLDKSLFSSLVLLEDDNNRLYRLSAGTFGDRKSAESYKNELISQKYVGTDAWLMITDTTSTESYNFSADGGFIKNIKKVEPVVQPWENKTKLATEKHYYVVLETYNNKFAAIQRLREYATEQKAEGVNLYEENTSPKKFIIGYGEYSPENAQKKIDILNHKTALIETFPKVLKKISWNASITKLDTVISKSALLPRDTLRTVYKFYIDGGSITSFELSLNQNIHSGFAVGGGYRLKPLTVYSQLRFFSHSGTTISGEKIFNLRHYFGMNINVWRTGDFYIRYDNSLGYSFYGRSELSNTTIFGADFSVVPSYDISDRISAHLGLSYSIDTRGDGNLFVNYFSLKAFVAYNL